VPTSGSVRDALTRDLPRGPAGRDWLQRLLQQVTRLCTGPPDWESVLVPGPEAWAVAVALGSALARGGRLLVLVNGPAGRRLAHLAQSLDVSHQVLTFPDLDPWPVAAVAETLAQTPALTHIAAAHVEPGLGLLNPLDELQELSAARGCRLILDVTGSAGVWEWEEPTTELVIGSAGRGVQAFPGLEWISGPREVFRAGAASGPAWQLPALWENQSAHDGCPDDWPAPLVSAFAQALEELEAEGGIRARQGRYRMNQDRLVAGLQALGFEPLMPREQRAPTLVAFQPPPKAESSLPALRESLFRAGFRLPHDDPSDLLRIGTAGQISPDDISRFLAAFLAALDQLDAGPAT